MQYVRMALRDSATTPKEVQEATQQTSLRKVKEMRMALDLTSQLVDLVLYQFHGVGPKDVERIEAAG